MFRADSLRTQIRVVEEDENGAGAGNEYWGVSIREPEVARILALRRDVPDVVASRDGTSVDRIMYRPLTRSRRREHCAAGRYRMIGADLAGSDGGAP